MSVDKSDKQLKDDYWFGRKKYGYGWVPINKYGWYVVLGYAFLVMFGAWFILKDAPDDDIAKEAVIFIVYTLVLVALFFYICSKKGPKPRWQRGGEPIRKTRNKA